MGDISGFISPAGDAGKERTPTERKTGIADKFKPFEGKVYLPQFVIMENKRPRILHYESDILAKLDWDKLYDAALEELTLSDTGDNLHKTRIGLQDDTQAAAEELTARETENTHADMPADSALMTQQLLDIIPNPWHAHPKTERILTALSRQETARGIVRGASPEQRIAANFIYIIEETKRLLAAARDAMAEAYFKEQVGAGRFQLMLLKSDGADAGKFSIPKSVTVRSAKKMNRGDGSELQRSLFDYVPDEDMNGLERSVALYLDDQQQMLWWYRNQVHHGYAIQGWQSGRIYPDLIAARRAGSEEEQRDSSGAGQPDSGEDRHDSGEERHGSKGDKTPPPHQVLVLETKGSHLTGNADTEYKKSVFQLCNDLCSAAGNPRLCSWQDLARDFSGSIFRFQMVNEDDWRKTVSNLLQ